jgi:hypothetical protein
LQNKFFYLLMIDLFLHSFSLLIFPILDFQRETAAAVKAEGKEQPQQHSAAKPSLSPKAANATGGSLAAVA